MLDEEIRHDCVLLVEDHAHHDQVKHRHPGHHLLAADDDLQNLVLHDTVEEMYHDCASLNVLVVDDCLHNDIVEMHHVQAVPHGDVRHDDARHAHAKEYLHDHTIYCVLVACVVHQNLVEMQNCQVIHCTKS